MPFIGQPARPPPSSFINDIEEEENKMNMML